MGPQMSRAAAGALERILDNGKPPLISPTIGSQWVKKSDADYVVDIIETNTPYLVRFTCNGEEGFEKLSEFNKSFQPLVISIEAGEL